MLYNIVAPCKDRARDDNWVRSSQVAARSCEKTSSSSNGISVCAIKASSELPFDIKMNPVQVCSILLTFSSVIAQQG